jgi:peroxiredoxin
MKKRFDERGVGIVVVSFAEPDRLAYYQRLHNWPFVMLADPERKAYGYFGLKRLPWHRVFSLSTLKLYAHLLLKGRKLENYGRDDFYQSGGDFLLDESGKIVFAHRSHDPADRPGVGRLLEEVEKLPSRF